MGRDDDSMSRDGRAIVKAIREMSDNHGKWMGLIVEAIISNKSDAVKLTELTERIKTTREALEAVAKQSKET